MLAFSEQQTLVVFRQLVSVTVNHLSFQHEYRPLVDYDLLPLTRARVPVNKYELFLFIRVMWSAISMKLRAPPPGSHSKAGSIFSPSVLSLKDTNSTA